MSVVSTLLLRWIYLRASFMSSSSLSLLDSDSSAIVIRKDVWVVVWPPCWGLMFWTQSSDALRILCRFLFSFSCVLHNVECLSHVLMEHSPLNPVFCEWFPLPQELPLAPGLRCQRQTIQYSSLSVGPSLYPQSSTLTKGGNCWPILSGERGSGVVR